MALIKCSECGREVSDKASACPGCGAPIAATPPEVALKSDTHAKVTRTEANQNYIDAHSKSQVIGFFLTLFFGPLGLFYSSWVGALILIVLAIISAASIIGPVVCWIIAMMVSAYAIEKHNEKIEAAAALQSNL